MKKRLSTLVELTLLTIPFITIGYALISLWVFFRHHWYCILFPLALAGAGDSYREKVWALTGSRAISIVLSVLCYAAAFAVLYATGYMEGTLVPW